MYDMSENRFHVEDPILLIDFVNFVLILISIDYFINLIIVKIMYIITQQCQAIS